MIDYNKNPWKVISQKEVYQNKWISLDHCDVITPGGNSGVYGIVHFKLVAICILPVTNDGYIYLVGQYRLAVNRWSWELPSGGGEINEEPLEAAKRELKEECGLIAHTWEKLFSSYISISITDEYGHVFLAKDLEISESSPEDTEELIIKKVSIDEALQMIKSGEICDIQSQLAITHYKLNQK